MTAVQLNAELYRTMSVLAEDEGLMAKLLKYAKKLAAKKEDPTLMTKEEFYARVDEAIEQAKEGRVHRMMPGETMDQFLDRVG